jgi:ceramide glucosyltransferase
MYLSADLLGINCVTGMSCLFRKDILEDAGGFSYLGKFLAEDYYLGKVFIDR